MSSRIIGKLDISNKAIANDLITINTFPIIEEEYSEFGTGIWKNNSLFNENGEFTDTQYRNYLTKGKKTELLTRVPYINNLIETNFDITYLKMVRTRNLINGIILPHKDFVEFNKTKSYYLRIFIPLEDNVNAYHSDEHAVFRMQKGEVWILNAAIIHAAANFSTASRIFLCLDFQFPKTLDPSEIFLDKSIYNLNIKPLIPARKPLDSNYLKETIERLAAEINRDNFKDVIIELSKIHFFYQANVSQCYDWLIQVSEKSGIKEIINQTLLLKEYMIIKRKLGQRFLFV